MWVIISAVIQPEGLLDDAGRDPLAIAEFLVASVVSWNAGPTVDWL